MAEQVLSLSMRPKSLSDMVGQDELINALNEQFASNRIPHFYIISGPIGCGKTTLSKILSLIIQTAADAENIKDVNNLPWDRYKVYDIMEINAANKNGIDDIRQLVETMKYKPLAPSKAKIVILDEAHQLTTAAQNALLTETEDTANHVFYIFCTSCVTKIIPALQRRAYIISPKLLTDEKIKELIVKGASKCKFEESIDSLHEILLVNDIRSPGLILQAAEKFFNGIPAHVCISLNSDISINSLEFCRTVLKGEWKKSAGFLKDITKTEVNALRNCLLGYMKNTLVKSTGNKALIIAKCIQMFANNNGDEGICLPTFVANVCLTCEKINQLP